MLAPDDAEGGIAPDGPHDPCGIEVAIVVRDDDDGAALVLRLREDRAVEEVAELRILIGRPLVEEEDGSILERAVTIDRRFRWPDESAIAV
jgi:hypothetical protein